MSAGERAGCNGLSSVVMIAATSGDRGRIDSNRSASPSLHARLSSCFVRTTRDELRLAAAISGMLDAATEAARVAALVIVQLAQLQLAAHAANGIEAAGGEERLSLLLVLADELSLLLLMRRR